MHLFGAILSYSWFRLGSVFQVWVYVSVHFWSMWGTDYTEIRAAVMVSRVPHRLQRGKQEEMGPAARFSCVYILQGSQSGRVPILPCLPHHPLPHSLPSSFSLLASTALCVSGQISPTVGSAGLCGGLFILERGLPSGSLHLSKHPPGRCSCVPGLAQPPPPPPPPSLASSLLGSLCSLWHPLLFYHSLTTGFCHYSYSLSIFTAFCKILSSAASFFSFVFYVWRQCPK